MRVLKWIKDILYFIGLFLVDVVVGLLFAWIAIIVVVFVAIKSIEVLVWLFT